MTAERQCLPTPPGASAVSRLVTVRGPVASFAVLPSGPGGVIVGLAILFRRLSEFHTLLIEAVHGDATLIDDVRALASRLGMRNCSCRFGFLTRTFHRSCSPRGAV